MEKLFSLQVQLLFLGVVVMGVGLFLKDDNTFLVGQMWILGSVIIYGISLSRF